MSAKETRGSSGNRVGDSEAFQSSGSMQVSILSRRYRGRRSLDGTTPAQCAGMPPAPAALLNFYVWRQHCHGLFQTPMAG